MLGVFFLSYCGDGVERGLTSQSPLTVCLRHGVRNSLLLAPMPTASTAQILGNNESFEAYTSNIYTRRVLSGEFQVSGEGMQKTAAHTWKEKYVELFFFFSSLQIVNPHLLKDLTDRGLWNDDMKNQLIAQNGSIQVHALSNLNSYQTYFVILVSFMCSKSRQSHLK